MHNKIEIRNKGLQLGVFAVIPFEKGDTLLNLDGVITTCPSKYSIQMDMSFHLEVPESTDPHNTKNYQWRFLNHSCFPNSHVDVLNKKLIALEPIAEGTEICFNYNSTEYRLAEPFECLCNNQSRLIKGYQYTSPEEKEFIKPLLAPYLSSLNLL
jgi:hypothetical protein